MWHNLMARECAAEAQAGSEMAEVEESPALPAPGLQQEPGELRFAESSPPVVIPSPVPAATATNRSHLPFARGIWCDLGGDEPRGRTLRLFLLLPAAAAGGFGRGCSALPAPPRSPALVPRRRTGGSRGQPPAGVSSLRERSDFHRYFLS